MICFFFFNDTATTEIYTLSLHDALPISTGLGRSFAADQSASSPVEFLFAFLCALCVFAVKSPYPSTLRGWEDRKSTRLNSSHANISYAVFCLKKKKNITTLSIV